MTKARKQSIAKACAATAGVIIVLCVGALLADYVVARVLTPRDDRRHAELQAQIRYDATFAPKLAEDQKAVTERRLGRKARGTFLAYVLIASGALFICCCWWLLGQRPRQPVALSRLVPPKRRAAPAARTVQAARPAEVRSSGKPSPVHIRIGLAACGIASGGEAVRAALEQEAAAAGVAGAVKLAGCNGMCHCEPMVEVVETGGKTLLYGNVTVDAACQIARRHLRPARISTWARWSARRIAERFARNGRPLDLGGFRVAPDNGYLARQKRVVLENCGQVDPSSIDDYLARDGYRALARCVESLSPEGVLAEISIPGLRESGSAPLKLEAPDGDQADTRAFAGRLLLESDPHRVLEGLAIAAYAAGASEACVYVRAGRALAVSRVSEAIQQAGQRGFLGRNILGSQFSLRVEVHEGPGVWSDHATPSVETMASVPWIIRHGRQAFAALGAPAGRGTKLLSLAGKISRPGVVEVPMGTTVRQVVEEIGGGAKSGRPFKAVLVGGLAGGFLPASLADTRIEPESLARAGAGLGSGSLVVFDDRDCMVDAARAAVRTMSPGAKPLLEILERICKGKGEPDDLEKLDLAMGEGAPAAAATTLRYFRDEYAAHILGRSCPAGRCRALIRYVVNDNCIGCTLCAQVCPSGAIEYRPYQKHAVAAELCTLCDKCWQACQENAIEIVASEGARADA